MAEIPVKIGKEQEQALVNMADRLWTDFPSTNFRTRLELIDLAYSRERSAELKDDRLKTTQLQPIVTPVIQPQVDTMTSQLVGMFLKGNPIFSVSSSPGNEEAVASFNALLKDHSQRSQYVAQFILWLQSGTRYNLNAMEVDWAPGTEITYANALEGTEASVNQVTTYFNKLKWINPYNLFFDTNVRPSEVHTRGEFAGYHEMIGRIELKKLFASLDAKFTRNATKAYESSPDKYDYIYAPDIINVDEKFKNATGNQSSVDWEAHFGFARRGSKINYRNYYILTTLYVRLLPSDLGLDLPQKNTPRIFKVLLINGKHPIYVEEQTAAHGYLPIVIGQLFDGGLGLQTKSFVENLEPVQNLVAQLHTARIADLARALADRGFYDPSLVDHRTVNSPNPSAKMPVKPAAYGRLNQLRVYEPVPYRNETAPNLINEAQIVSKYGEDIGGLNPVQRGNFVKGNKTLGEFSEVMGNADERTQVVFMMLHAQSIVPMQEMIKNNLLQYQPPKEVYDEATKTMVKFDPAKIRQIALKFDMADGLQPQNIFRNPELLTSALQFIQNSPQMQQQYDQVGLFAHIFNVRGATDLNSFRLSPEQVQQNQQAAIQQQAALAAAQNAGKPQG